jgi:hypothetical protein
MTQPGTDGHVEVQQLLDAAGITVTPEGRQRAHRKLADADLYWTQERRAQGREAFLRDANGA